ncbi:gamma-aminobutyraldehyde dehydrogenase [Enteractinococcus helveticum]|uniref:Gamma-aminobutyraldehyde dehydrogenase n=1 Tax=Enteractinococcus helveticum TaxID=1837282 RepID=A0A1B7M0L9_9MICC|nr:gamma-aminobutyraldehyde dehydrogenase [Enteractinococcus helveticum]
MPQCSHFIDGQHVDPSGSETTEVVDPARGKAIVSLRLGNEKDVDTAVCAARAALPTWAAKTPQARSELLLALAEAIATDRENLEKLEAINCGKPLAVTADDVDSTIDVFRFMAGAGRTGSTIPAGDYVADTMSLVLREPIGVIGLVTPWNYPLLMGAWKISAALMAGNTVVYKPSEVTPLTSLRLAELAKDILPAGVLNLVLGTGPEVGQSLSKHPQVDMMALTGSVRAGMAVASTIASDLKRGHFELGGKAPVIICDDADLENAANTVTEAGYWNSGQECGAATRVIIHESVADEFTQLLAQKVGSYVLADPEIPGEENLGPMIYQGHYAKVMDMIGEAVERGAEIVLGGNGDDSAGFWVEPTILKVSIGDPITENEVFGPVVTIETFSDLTEAVERANAVEYGLTGSVFTADVSTALEVSKALDFGSVNVNTHLALPTEMPWSGFKHSGYGRDLSAYALDDFSRTKHIAIRH